MTPGPRPVRRTLKTILIVVLAVPALAIVLAALAMWRSSRETKVLGDQVVAEVNAIHSRKHPRPPHVTPATPGTFADAITPLVPELIAFKKREGALPDPEKDPCVPFREAKRPMTELPVECAARLDRARPLMLQVLAAARAEEGGLPQEMRASANYQQPAMHDAYPTIHRLMRLSGLEVRRLTHSGDTKAAVTMCVDSLAVGRDLQPGNSLIGAMVAAAVTTGVRSGCAEALDASTAAEKKAALDGLRLIRIGSEPLSARMREDMVSGALSAYGPLFSEEQLAALPEGARASALFDTGTYDDTPMPAFNRAVGRHAWTEWHPFMQEVIPYADLPRAERTAKLKAMSERVVKSWNPIVKMGFPDYSKFFDRFEQHLAQLDLLVAITLVELARAETGAWPSAVPELYPSATPKPVHVAKFELKPSADGASLELIAKDPVLAAEVRHVVHADAK